MQVFWKHILLLFALTLFLACERNDSLPSEQSVKSIHTRIAELQQQIKQELEAGHHEVYIHAFIQMLDLVRQLPHDDPELFEIRMDLVHFANVIGLYQQGIELTNLMIEELKNDTGLLAAQRNELLYGARAACYFELNQFENAREAYRWDIFYKNKQHPKYPPVSTLNNIGMTFQLEGREDSAMIYFRSVESILQNQFRPIFGNQANDEIFYGSVRDNIASILLHQARHSEASPLYAENFQMYRKYPQHRSRLMNAGLQLAECQLQLGSIQDAGNTIRTLDSLFAVSNYANQREHQLSMYQIQSMYYDKRGATEQAMAFQQQYIELADSLYEAQLAITKLSSQELIKYKASQFTRDIEQAKRESLLQQQKARLRFWILLLVIVVTIAGGLLLAVSLRQRLRLAQKEAALNESERQLAAAHTKTIEQEKALLDVALQQKKKDIASMALNASIKKEWAERLDIFLSHVEESRGHRRILALKKLREEIRSHLHADQRIGQFQENIETLNTEFYENLTARNPDLSKNEIRLMSFLKLRMSNDEIAMMQGISTRSVIMSRYRLKKKLHLPENVDLDTYCHQL